MTAIPRHVRRPASAPPAEEAWRQEILRAAFDLFAAQGYTGTSMDAVAEAAETNKREIYRNFASKKDLFCEAVAFRCRELLEGGGEAEPLDVPTVVLTHFGHRLIQIVVRPRTVALERAVVGDLERHPKLGAWLLEASMGTAADILTPKLKAWHRQGRLRVPEPRESAIEFIDAVVGKFNGRAILGAGAPPTKREIAKHLNAQIEIFLNTHAAP